MKQMPFTTAAESTAAEFSVLVDDGISISGGSLSVAAGEDGT